MSERTDAHYDPKKGTITDANGVVRDVHFSLPDDVQKELDAKLADLHAFCVEHAIPYRGAYVVAHAEKKHGHPAQGNPLGSPDTGSIRAGVQRIRANDARRVRP